jgi:AcrR family transcriptional regulator
MGDVTENTVADLFGNGRAPQNTREKLLFKALDLFSAYGIHAVGIDRIYREVGVTKTTFYNHFESKDDLVQAALALRDEWEQETFGRHLQAKAGYDPTAMLLAAFDVLDDWFNKPEYRGCLFMAACAEYPSGHDPVHKAGARHYLATEEAIGQMAEAAGVAEPKEFAQEWVVLLEGAVSYRMITGDDGVAQRARRVAEVLLKERLGHSAP